MAFRTAMDHPDEVERLVVMDGLPVIEHLERLNEAFVRTWWHWWFLSQTDKPAETFISADPDRWYRTPSRSEKITPVDQPGNCPSHRQRPAFISTPDTPGAGHPVLAPSPSVSGERAVNGARTPGPQLRPGLTHVSRVAEES